MSGTIVIDRRFNGPPGAGHGGYFCGRVAAAVRQPVNVRLHRPIPLDAPLAVAAEGENAWRVTAGEELVATATRSDVRLAPPHAPSYVEALAAARRYRGLKHHPMPTCFGCGPERRQGEGLRLFAGPGPVPSTVAAPWLPDVSLADAGGKVQAEFMWAALDCPGYYAAVADDRPAVLGELAVRIDRRVPADEPCVILAWPIASEGRKHRVGAALYAEEGDVCAVGLATWIELKASEK